MNVASLPFHRIRRHAEPSWIKSSPLPGPRRSVAKAVSAKQQPESPFGDVVNFVSKKQRFEVDTRWLTLTQGLRCKLCFQKQQHSELDAHWFASRPVFWARYCLMALLKVFSSSPPCTYLYGTSWYGGKIFMVWDELVEILTSQAWLAPIFAPAPRKPWTLDPVGHHHKSTAEINLAHIVNFRIYLD